jgi:outer membrane immunogenic protein
LGWLPFDNLLVYGTGGFAYGRVERTGNFTLVPGPGGLTGVGQKFGAFSYDCGIGVANPCFAGSSGDTATGWTAGGGLEWAFLPNWSLKGEYLFVSLHNDSLTETAQAVLNPGDIPASFNANFSRANYNIVRVGLNYQFH